MKLIDYIVYFFCSSLVFGGIMIVADLLTSDSIDWPQCGLSGVMYGLVMVIWQYFAERKKKSSK